MKLTQSSLFSMLCKMFGDKAISSKGSYVLVKGEVPVMLLAHLDTVHREPVQMICSGETLNRKIDKTEEVMEEAADVIEHLLKKLSTKKRELEYMKDFSREACFESEECRDQLRSLWTAYCLHNNLIVDTGTYDDDILELWSAVSLGEEDTAEWSDFDSFDDFMCAHLV